MKLTIKQTKALDLLEDNTTTELLFGGGAGGGKSILGCYWLLKMCFKYPGTRWVMGRSSLKTLKETTLNSFFFVCQQQELKSGQHYRYNAQSGIIYFPNGSEILLKDMAFYPSDPQFDELGSLEITGAFVDECNQIIHKAWLVLKSRIRYKLDEYGIVPKMLGSCNPSKEWVYRVFYKPYRDNKLPRQMKFIQALLSDNPEISEHYRGNLLSLDKASIERLLHGNWEYSDDPALLCDYDAILDMFTCMSPEKGDRAISADLAMQGRDNFVVGYWEGLDCTIEIDKPQAKGKEIEQDIADLMRRKKVGHTQTVVDSDGMGAYLESYLTGIKEFHGGAQAIDKNEFGNLKSECGYKLAEVINKRKIRVHCTEDQKDKIIKEVQVLKAASVDADETRKRIIKKDLMKELIGNSPDYLDMLLMRMLFLVKPKTRWLMQDIDL